MTEQRLRQGVEWHAWAWKTADPDWQLRNRLFHWAEPMKPTTRPTPNGQWVRVRFVEVRRRK